MQADEVGAAVASSAAWSWGSALAGTWPGPGHPLASLLSASPLALVSGLLSESPQAISKSRQRICFLTAAGVLSVSCNQES